ncbi:MAG: head GIN domain-containing protein [Pseudomonadota bacterium]
MRTLLAIAVAATLSGCIIVAAPPGGEYAVHTPFSGKTVDGDGVAARDTRQVGALTGLDVGGAMIVEVRVGGAPSLVVEGDSNLVHLVQTETRGSTLHIGTEGRLRSTTPLKVTYTVPRLTELNAGGSGHVTVRDLKGEPLDVRQGGSGVTRLVGEVAELDARVSGSGKIDAGELRAGSAKLAVSGSGRLNVGQVRGDYARASVSGSGLVQASGAVQRLNVSVSGSGSVDMASLTSEQGELSTSGSGGISATVRQSVFAQASGSGPIRVYGQPAQRNISGRTVQIL